MQCLVLRERTLMASKWVQSSSDVTQFVHRLLGICVLSPTIQLRVNLEEDTGFDYLYI